MAFESTCHMACFPFEKARWGKDGGPGGKETPLCASRDRRRPQAVPVATKEATGIDSRDKGVSFPQKNYLEQFNFEMLKNMLSYSHENSEPRNTNVSD